MTRKILLILFLMPLFITISCNNDTSNTEYIEIPTSPVSVDLTKIPYQKLSEYLFFEGELKNLKPSLDVIPYNMTSALFTDYALKKRFVWLPKGEKATYNGDNEILDLPVGAALIKTFYYNKVQPQNNTKIIETRVMIKKQTGWIFAEYVWNDTQTEAFLLTSGEYKNIEWKNENNETKIANYRIPSNTECLICHKTNDEAIPIGIKPQNLNTIYNYKSGPKNQLKKWVELGMLENNLPQNIVSMVNYEDTTKSIELRLRSYLDVNCAHCHKSGSHCDYRPMRLAFSETSNPTNVGVCVTPDETINTALTKIILPNSINRSVMHFRLNTTDESVRMPLLGRSLIHTEGVQLLAEYINLLPPCN